MPQARSVPVVMAIAAFGTLMFGGYAQAATMPYAPQVSGILCDVTSYGADPTGTSDSTLAMRNAINTCEATKGPNTVYVPAGTYKLDVNDNGDKNSSADLLIKGGYPVIFAGAGASVTTIVEWIGSKRTCGSSPCVPKNLLYNLTDGTRVTGVTLDTQTHDAGRTIVNSASKVTLDNSTILGGDHTYAIRFNGGQGSLKSAPIRATGNVIHDVTVNDQSGAVYAGFDFSFQQHGQIYNIVHTGSRLGLYVPSYVTVTNYLYTPSGVGGAATRSFFVTPPADHITITGFHTYGQGGIIAWDPTYRTDTITITDELVYNPTTAGTVNQLEVDDATNVTIKASSLQRLFFSPSVSTDGVIVASSTIQLVWCYPATQGTITNLNGVVCPSTTKLSSSVQRINLGQPVTFTATMKATAGLPTGTATFFSNGAPLGIAPVGGGTARLTTSSLPLGQDLITVTYNGDAVFGPSTSGTFTEHVH